MTKPPPLKSDLDAFTAGTTTTSARLAGPPLPDGMVWEDPPAPQRSTKSDWQTLLAPLVQYPGRWARLRFYPKPNSATSAASYLKSGKGGLPPGRWEFAGRKVDGGSALYARYLGPEDGA